MRENATAFSQYFQGILMERADQQSGMVTGGIYDTALDMVYDLNEAHLNRKIAKSQIGDLGTVDITDPANIEHWVAANPDTPFAQVWLLNTEFINDLAGVFQLRDEHDDYEWIYPQEATNYSLGKIYTQAIQSAFKEK